MISNLILPGWSKLHPFRPFEPCLLDTLFSRRHTFFNMSNKLRYAVVEFTEEDEVEVVPVGWLMENQKKCYWPNLRSSSKISSLIRAEVVPKEDFKQLPIRVLAKTTEYEDARRKLSKATYTSDLQTDAEDSVPRRTKRPNPRFIDSESEDESPEQVLVPRRQSPRKQKRTSFPELPPLPSPPLPLPTQSTSSANSLFDQGSKGDQSATEKRIFSCLEKLLTTVEEMKIQMRINKQLLEGMITRFDGLKGLVAQEETESAEKVDIGFPLKTKEDLENLEDLLASSETSKSLVRSLSTIGGENLKANVRRLLAHIFSNDLAKNVNWVGKGGKIAFSALKLKQVLTATVRRNKLCSSSTDAEICNIIKDWFRFAADRDGGRKKREQKKKEQAELTVVADTD